ncbi:SH3 domain-binding protein 2 isoform X3 [Echeneis naucrates]|uniref:SH3 domain-binding protein 2 n=1 Tax=Echeneis naucrates TaxID=173247 RepID=A0A665WVJ4_ECHNA|nr:SH3 domain-binding protein 2 isoform X3 [Echeneis naucrates]
MSIDMSAPSMRKKSFARTSKPSVKMCFREQRDFVTMSCPEASWPVPMRAIGAQNLLTMPGGVSTAGYLHKKGGSQFSLLKWPLRYIIIHKGCVYYFKSSTSPSPQGAFSLNGYNRVMRAAEETTSSNVFPFKIVHFSKRHRTWVFSAASEDERRKWMRYLRREIDHYNDRKDSHIPSDSDSDADSFYGTIEKPMDIKHIESNAEDDYIEEDDDDEEEDYLKPDDDNSPTSTGRPTGPPPSYPPPPVPAVFQLHLDSSTAFSKGPPPPIPPQHKVPTALLTRKPLPSHPPPSILKDPNKGLPPPLPFAPHLQKPSYPGPPPPPPNPKRTHQSTITLPICDQLETRMILNGPAHCSLKTGGTPSLANIRSKPTLQLPNPANIVRSPTNPSLSPLLKPQRSGIFKPPPPAVKPPLPAPKSNQPGAPLQRSSPEGQSFRSSGEGISSEFRGRQGKHRREDDSDEDYENMQLPDSVFIDTTETTIVEKLFREGPTPPEDGLYGIRNSGTKTSKVLVVWDISIGKARNYRLFEEANVIFLETEMTFPCLKALIQHYHSHPLPHQGSLCLQKPFTKI